MTRYTNLPPPKEDEMCALLGYGADVSCDYISVTVSKCMNC